MCQTSSPERDTAGSVHRRRAAEAGASEVAFPAVRIVAVGRLGRGPEAELFERYRGRVRPLPVLVEIPEARGPAAEARRREGAAVLAALPRGARVAALDQGGRALDTAALARWLDPAAPPPCFVLGGPDGLDPAVTARAALLLSLGPMTWPHLLARVMLAEQIYRAYSIAAGHPYHRAARP